MKVRNFRSSLLSDGFESNPILLPETSGPGVNLERTGEIWTDSLATP